MIPGYRNIRIIQKSEIKTISYAVCSADNRTVILKTLNPSFLVENERNRLRHEFRILRKFDNKGIIKAFELIDLPDISALVLEDFGAVSLIEQPDLKNENPAAFLRIALKITRALCHVHAAGIVCGEVEPAHILTNGDTGCLKLTGFSNACSPESRNRPLVKPLTAYTAPEQTNRMDRVPDHRSDLYSLGVVFYELLTHQRPFDVSGELELTHNILAKKAENPTRIIPGIPQILSDIVMRLMEKSPGNRYQSADSLLNDLETCEKHCDTDTMAIPVFRLAEKNIWPQIKTPSKIYGRKKELETMAAAFQRAAQGSFEFVIVTGEAGIGKTALVNEFHRSISDSEHIFLSGKWDQLSPPIPLQGIVMAFSALTRILMAKAGESIEKYAGMLTEAVGPNLAVITRIIPEMEFIIGSQPGVSILSPTEARKRFHLIFIEFLRVFTSKEHPIILFLDDLQWADAPSLSLLDRLSATAGTHHMLLILAYRDNAPNSDLIKKKLHAKKGRTIHTRLAPLQQKHLCDMLCDTLNCSVERGLPLTLSINNNTRGNPFFYGEFLKSLHNENLLWIKDGQWCWSLENIRRQKVSGSIVDLLIQELKALPASTMELLKIAASMGNQFDIRLLAHIAGNTPQQAATVLQPCLFKGMLVRPTSGRPDRRAPVEKTPAHQGRTLFQFAHDRIQQATLAMMDEKELPAFHLKIGRRLLKLSADERSELLFNMVNHLNKGRQLITDGKERIELAGLNLAAADKARQSSAFESAHQFLETGVDLLDDGGWQTAYDLTLEIHVALAETAYFTGHLDQLDRITKIALKNSATLMDKIRVHEIILDGCIARNMLEEAVQKALTVLRLLDVKIPETPKPIHILSGFIKTRLYIGPRPVEDLIELKSMAQPEKLAAMRILQKAGTAAYFVMPELTPFFVFNMVNISVRYGNAPESTFAYLTYGLILCGVLGDIDKGYRAGVAAVKLMEKLKAFQYRARIIQVFTCTIRHWKKPLQSMIAPFMEAQRRGMESGDLEYSAFSALLRSTTFFLAGNRLDRVLAVMEETRSYILKLGQESALPQQTMFHQAVLNLMDQSRDPCRLSGAIHDENEMILMCRERRQPHILNHFYLNQLMLCVYFRDYGRAVMYARKAEQTLDSVISLTSVPWIHFFGSLAKLSNLSGKEKKEKKRLLKEVKTSLGKMKKWALHCPENYAHKHLLMKAELFRVTGPKKAAAYLYPRAADLARESGYLNEYALASELAAHFYLNENENRTAGTFFQNAFNGYQQWGATAKVRQLRHQMTNYLTDETGPVFFKPPPEKSRPAGTDIDLSSVLKMNQALSKEINYNKLRQTLISLLMENAGAEKAVLVLTKNGKPVVEAIGYADKKNTCLMPSVPIRELDSLCIGIVRYTIRRKTPLVIHNATSDPVFRTDPYVRNTHPLSILCVPLVIRSVITGVIYLENNLVSHAFKADRVGIISMLSSQMAISIENARLYSEKAKQAETISQINTRLEKEIRERTITEKKYRMIFENASEGIFQLTEKGSLITVNPALVQMLGYDSEAELMKRTETGMEAMFVNRADFITLLDLISHKKRVRDFPTQLNTKGKHPVHVMINAHRSSFAGRNVEVFEGSVIDLTQQKKAEEWRIAKGRAEAVAKAKSIFFARMNHEIRTPLNAVIGFSQLVVKTADPDRQKFYMRSLKSSAEILGHLVDDVLDFSKIEEGRLELEVLAFNLPDLISGLADMISRQIEEKGLGFRVKMDADVPCTLVGDSFRLRQVLINLLNNAVKFTDRGDISVHVSKMDKDRQGEVLLSFSVTDTGSGIDRNMLQVLFDPYVQGSPGIPRQHGGTGLGLSICKKLVEMMGGGIRVDSTPGKGSTFSFTALFKSVSDSRAVEAPDTAQLPVTGNTDTIQLPVTGNTDTDEIPDPPYREKIDEHTLHLLEKLDRMLTARNLKACIYLEKLKQSLQSGGDDPEILRLDAHVQNLEFKSARACLAKLTRRFTHTPEDA